MTADLLKSFSGSAVVVDCRNISLQLLLGGAGVACVQTMVIAALREELAVAAGFDELTMLHDEDVVGVANGGQAVRDDEHGLFASQFGEGLLHLLFGVRIEGGGGFVENENVVVAQKGTGDGQKLALSLRKNAALVVENGVVALGQRLDDLIKATFLAGADDSVAADVRLAEANVVEDAGIEEHGLLWHDADVAMDLVKRDLRKISAADGDASLLRQVVAEEKIGQRGLASASGANDGDGLACRNGGGDIAEHGRVVVAEMHMLKTDAVILREGSWSLAAERFALSRRIEHAKNARRGETVA